MGEVNMSEVASIDTPATGYHILAYKAADGLLYTKDELGVEQALAFATDPLTVTAVTATTTLTSANYNRVYTNEGASGAPSTRPITLPTAAAGARVEFINQNANGLRVVAAAGDTIRISEQVTKTAGYVECFNTGNTIVLTAINSSEWIAQATGTDWIVETS